MRENDKKLGSSDEGGGRQMAGDPSSDLFFVIIGPGATGYAKLIFIYMLTIHNLNTAIREQIKNLPGTCRYLIRPWDSQSITSSSINLFNLT